MVQEGQAILEIEVLMVLEQEGIVLEIVVPEEVILVLEEVIVLETLDLEINFLFLIYF